MEFIETTVFTTLLPKYLSDCEYRAFQCYLLMNPDAGDIVRGSGGIRKIRWAPGGKEKSGSLRIMYYWKKSENEIWLLTIFSKNQKATISGHILKKIVKEIQNG